MRHYRARELLEKRPDEVILIDVIIGLHLNNSGTDVY